MHRRGAPRANCLSQRITRRPRNHIRKILRNGMGTGAEESVDVCVPSGTAAMGTEETGPRAAAAGPATCGV